MSGLGIAAAGPLNGRTGALALAVATIAIGIAAGMVAADPEPGPVTPVVCVGRPAPASTTDDAMRYDGLSAVLVHPRDQAQLEFVVDVAYDVWTEAWGLRGMVVVVDDAGMALLRDAGLDVEVQIEDIQAAADAERDRLAAPAATRPTDWFADYKRFEAVDAYVTQLAQSRPDLASVSEIGRSVQGRPLRAIRVTAPGLDQDARTTIVLNGGQHAREWISVMTTTCIADRLVRLADSDPRVGRVLAEHQFVIVPVVNPDGYVYSWDKDRYWRKNRAGRHGVDLNRNWDWAWGKSGSSTNPRSQIYAGPSPFSEPETRAMRDLMLAEAPVAHVDLHSFSQLILFPWNHTRGAAPDRPRLSAWADKMASAIFATHAKSYKTIAGSELYPASGTFSDWAYGSQGVSSFVFELRPAKGTGFVLPPEEIVPTCDESFNAVLELAELAE